MDEGRDWEFCFYFPLAKKAGLLWVLFYMCRTGHSVKKNKNIIKFINEKPPIEGA